jgi:tetratricopeptide (TPR) repeat protein
MKLNGYMDERCETLIEMLLHDPDAFKKHVFNRWQAWWFVSDLAALGLAEEAEAWKERIDHIPLPESMYETGLNHYLEASGQASEAHEAAMLRLASMSDEEILNADNEQAEAWAGTLADAGEYERAIELLEAIRHAPASWAERETRPTLTLAELYLNAGRKDEAAPLLEKAVTYLEAEVDTGIRHPATLAELAMAYELQGRENEALDMLRKAVDYHYTESYQASDCSANNDEIEWLARRMDNPRALALCERMAADWQQQADRVKSMLAEHDIDELLAPLMALAGEEPDVE